MNSWNIGDSRSRSLHHNNDPSSSNCILALLHHLWPHCHGYRHHRGLHRFWRHFFANLLQLQAQEKEAGPQQSVNATNWNQDLRSGKKKSKNWTQTPKKQKNQDIVDWTKFVETLNDISVMTRKCQVIVPAVLLGFFVCDFLKSCQLFSFSLSV